GAVGGRAHFLDATALATRLAGDALATNLFMLGLAYQKGLIPLDAAALLRAMEIHALSPATGRVAFQWGRLAAADMAALTRAAAPSRVVAFHRTRSLATLLSERSAWLVAYQDE